MPQLGLSNYALGYLKEWLRWDIVDILDDPSYLRDPQEIPPFVSLMEVINKVFEEEGGFWGLIFNHENKAQTERFKTFYDENVGKHVHDEVLKREKVSSMP